MFGDAFAVHDATVAAELKRQFSKSTRELAAMAARIEQLEAS